MFQSIKIKEYDLLALFSKFITEMKTGRQRQINWKHYNENSLENYRSLFKHLYDFKNEMHFQLRIRDIQRMGERELKAEKKYWGVFDLNFRKFLYTNKGLHDNTVGGHMKLFRKFFKYLQTVKGINVGTFYKRFYAPSNESIVIALYPERLGYLIYSQNLDRRLKPITRVLLPEPLVKIIEKYKGGKFLLPYYHPVYINQYGKELMEKAGWTETFVKWRQRNGEPIPILVNYLRRGRVKHYYS